MTVKKRVSLIIPVFNEEANILPLYERTGRVLAPLAERFDFELLFTDNHSHDKSFEILTALAAKDPRVKIIRFSKNFGYQHSIYTGYVSCHGDAAIQLDCDLQDPPGLIPDFLKKWEEGFQVVYGIRRSRQEGFFIQWLRKLFYRLVHFLSEEKLPPDAGDFRLVDRTLLEELKKIHDMSPYLRGTIAALGYRQIGIPYDRDKRFGGKTKFGFKEMVGLALDGILNHSIFPLRIASYVGLATSLLTLLGIILYFVGRVLFGKDWPAGFATTTVLLLFAITLNCIFFGIIGEYLGRIYKQVKQRPMVVVERTINL